MKLKIMNHAPLCFSTIFLLLLLCLRIKETDDTPTMHSYQRIFNWYYSNNTPASGPESFPKISLFHNIKNENNSSTKRNMITIKQYTDTDDLPHQKFSLKNDQRFLLTTADVITKYICTYLLPSKLQKKFTEYGGFRLVSDRIVRKFVAPILSVKYRSLEKKYDYLTRYMDIIRYGEDPRQEIHLFQPLAHPDPEIAEIENSSISGFLFFVHGGAWGSGQAWMYRLLASSFLEKNIAVAIVGHRMYPDANVTEQVQDLSTALRVLLRTNTYLFIPQHDNYMGPIIMGHSSGAHTALLLLLEIMKNRIDFKLGYEVHFSSFIGLSGPYCIKTQFENEIYRGVQHISPMKPAFDSDHNFLLNSPHIQLHKFLSEYPDQISKLPRLLFVHGMQDTTVSFTSSANAAQLLRSVSSSNGGNGDDAKNTTINELYLTNVNHLDTVIHFMKGGKTCDAVINWLQYIDKYSTKIVLDDTS